MTRRALSKPKLQHMQVMKEKHDEIFVKLHIISSNISKNNLHAHMQ